MNNSNKMVNNFSPTLITGIFLLLISILILVIYIVKYKNVSFKKHPNKGSGRGMCKKEGFTVPTTHRPSLETLNFDNTIFDHLMDSSQYAMRINQIQNEKVDHENKRRSDLRDQTFRDKVKAKEMAKNRENKLIAEYKKKMDTEPRIVKSIKANSNNKILSTIPVGTDNYQIKINDKCLTVYDDNKYILDRCNNSIKMSDSQKFQSKRIHDLHSAKLAFGKDITKRAEYPYNVFLSKITNNCLTLDNDGVSVAKCNPNDNRQQFKISGQDNICPLA